MMILAHMAYVILLGVPAMVLHECGHVFVALMCGVKGKAGRPVSQRTLHGEGSGTEVEQPGGVGGGTVGQSGIGDHILE